MESPLPQPSWSCTATASADLYKGAMAFEATSALSILQETDALRVLPDDREINLGALSPGVLTKREAISNGLDFRIGSHNA